MSVRPPLVTAAAGCGGTGRELARFGDLAALDAVLIGPIGPVPAGTGIGDDRGHDRVRLGVSPASLVHTPAPALPVEHVVEDLLPWCAARGLPVVCAVRGGTTGAVADILHRLRRSLDFTAVVAVEVDLTTEREQTRPSIGALVSTDPPGPWSRDPQACLKLLAAAREQLPRNLLLTAKLAGECPDPLATSRAAIGGGARALTLSGSVPALTGHHLVGPAIGPVTLGLVTRVRAAMAAGRVPGVPVVAVGGVRDVPAALRARSTGATGVQLGSALLADPQALWEVHAALAAAPPPPDLHPAHHVPAATAYDQDVPAHDQDVPAHDQGATAYDPGDEAYDPGATAYDPGDADYDPVTPPAPTTD